MSLCYNGVWNLYLFLMYAEMPVMFIAVCCVCCRKCKRQAKLKSPWTLQSRHQPFGTFRNQLQTSLCSRRLSQSTEFCVKMTYVLIRNSFVSVCECCFHQITACSIAKFYNRQQQRYVMGLLMYVLDECDSKVSSFVPVAQHRYEFFDSFVFTVYQDCFTFGLRTLQPVACSKDQFVFVVLKL